MTQPRADGKKPNNHLPADKVAIIKTLYQKGVPSKLLATLYNVATSTVVMLGTNERRENVAPAPSLVAVTDLNFRFQNIVNSVTAPNIPPPSSPQTY